MKGLINITGLHHAFSVTASRCNTVACMVWFIIGLHHALSVTASRFNAVACMVWFIIGLHHTLSVTVTLTVTVSRCIAVAV